MAGTPEEKGVGPEQRLCKCHGLPMIKKGRLRCAVKYRAKQARYEKTEKGRASQRRKNQSEAGCRAKIKHAHSEKGKATCVRNRARNSPRRIYGYGGQYLGSVSAKKRSLEEVLAFKFALKEKRTDEFIKRQQAREEAESLSASKPCVESADGTHRLAGRCGESYTQRFQGWKIGPGTPGWGSV